MEAADARQRDNLGFSVWTPFHQPRCRRRLPEAQVRSVVVVVGHVVPQQSSEMALTQHDDVVEQFTTDAANPALGDAVGKGSRLQRMRRMGSTRAFG